MKKRVLAILLVLCMAAALMTACGSSAASTSTASDTAASSSGSASSAAASTSASEITIAIDADIDTLHPSDFSTTVELNVLNQIYDTLMYMNPDETHDPEPRIAESYSISDDGLDYTFNLREDATFQDGTPITASDVVFSIGLYMQSEYQGYEVDGLSSAEALDDYTVVCHLDTPYSPFLLGICNVHIASEDYYNKSEEDFVNNPVGSGPYKFVSHDIGSSVVLEAYDNYYRGAASIQKITFEVVPDDSTMAIALQTGEIDFAAIQAASLAQLEANKNLTIQRVDTSAFAYVCMNTEQAPFDNVLVREAINYAINRENLIDVCYDGEAEVNSNICSKTRMGYSDDQMQYSYDPDKAVALLAEAGIETPYDLGTMLIAEKYSNLATVVQADLAAVGLNVNLDVREFNSYIGDLVDGNYTISVLTMTLDGDTQALQMAFTTDYIGMANNARYSDPEMDEIFSETLTETDPDARAALFGEAFEKAQEEAIYAVLCNPLDLFAYSSNLNVPAIAFEGAYFVYDFSWAA